LQTILTEIKGYLSALKKSALCKNVKLSFVCVYVLKKYAYIFVCVHYTKNMWSTSILSL